MSVFDRVPSDKTIYYALGRVLLLPVSVATAIFGATWGFLWLLGLPLPLPGATMDAEGEMAAEGEYFTCKGRDGTPDVRFKNRDRWERRGPDLVCSYCGSMDPDDFMLWAHRSLEDDSEVIIDSSKLGKFYIRRKGITNAQEGAIRFFAFHFAEQPSGEQQDILQRALIAGVTRSRAQTKDLFEKLDKLDEEEHRDV